MAWEKTWLHRVRDSYLVTWKLNDEAINLDDIPSSAFDSPQEKQSVATQLETFTNTTSSLGLSKTTPSSARSPRNAPPAIPSAPISGFPPRASLPFGSLRASNFSPSPATYSPYAEAWEFDATDQIVTSTLTILNLIYLSMAVAGYRGFYGANRKPASPSRYSLAFIAPCAPHSSPRKKAPEPRYVLECFPIVLAFAAQIFVRKDLSEGTKNR